MQLISSFKLAHCEQALSLRRLDTVHVSWIVHRKNSLNFLQTPWIELWVNLCKISWTCCNSIKMGCVTKLSMCTFLSLRFVMLAVCRDFSKIKNTTPWVFSYCCYDKRLTKAKALMAQLIKKPASPSRRYGDKSRKWNHGQSELESCANEFRHMPWCYCQWRCYLWRCLL